MADPMTDSDFVAAIESRVEAVIDAKLVPLLPAAAKSLWSAQIVHRLITGILTAAVTLLVGYTAAKPAAPAAPVNVTLAAPGAK